jgi:hypothetical protein
MERQWEMREIDELKRKKQEEELNNFLGQFGKIGQLRKRLIALLISVEDVNVDLNAVGEEIEEIVELVERIEVLLGGFAISQQMADRIIISLTPKQRKQFIEKVPEILDIFGWQEKFDEGGNLCEET